MIDLLGLVVLVALLLLFAELTRNALRVSNPVVKGALAVLTGILTLGLMLALVFAGIAYYRVLALRTNPVTNIQVNSSKEQIARGERLAHLCVTCHASTGDLPLDGGNENLAARVGVPVGTIVAPNLTPGGHIKEMSDGQLIRAIREGLDEEGRPLLGMPTAGFRNLSDADVQALAAYLRAQPAQEHDTPPTSVNVLGAMARGIGLIPTSTQPPI